MLIPVVNIFTLLLSSKVTSLDRFLDFLSTKSDTNKQTKHLV